MINWLWLVMKLKLTKTTGTIKMKKVNRILGNLCHWTDFTLQLVDKKDMISGFIGFPTMI